VREAMRDHLRVGVHWNTDVRGASHRVCQVLTSAAPVAFTKQVRATEWQTFACSLLQGAFDATLLVAATLAMKRKARVRVFLTTLGTGLLGNRLNWVIQAIEKALDCHKEWPLDVLLVHYKTFPRESWAGLERRRPRVPIKRAADDRTIQEQMEFDLNHFNKGLTDLTEVTGSEAERLTSAFAYFDANGDGVIDRKEFTDVLKYVDDLFFTDDVIDQLIQEADVDGDGFIHYAEFAAWLCGADPLISSRFLSIGDMAQASCSNCKNLQ